MPRNSGGTYTLASGNPVISGTTITSTWANSTLNDVATAMTDSLDRSGKGGMLAALQAFDGTSSAPGISWVTEQSSGLYRKASHDFCFQVNSNTVMEWLAAGVRFPLGVLGELAVDASAEAVFTIGVKGTGAAQGDGVQGQGGSSSGAGVTGFGGLPNGKGAIFTGVGTGYAVEVGTNHALFSGGNPAASDAFTNVQTPVNMVKAFFQFTLNGTAAPTLNTGFNVAASNPVTVGSSIITCAFHSGNGMASGNYVASVTLDDNGGTSLVHARINTTGTGAVTIKLRDNSGTLLNPATAASGQVFYVAVVGAQ